jgi:hypothetical protein
MKNWILVSLGALIGGVISRFHGGGFAPSKKIWRNLAWSIPLACIAAWPYAGAGALAVFVLVLATLYPGKTTGHGQYMSLGKVVKRIDPERLDFIVAWFFGPDWRTDEFNTDMKYPNLYWRCMFGLAITGAAALSGAAIALAVINPLAGLAAFLGGFIGKPAAYAIGDALYPDGEVESAWTEANEATEIGEWLTGAFAFSAVVLSFFI